MRGAVRRPLGGVLDGGTSTDPSKIFPNLQVFEFLAPPGVLPGSSSIPPGHPSTCATLPLGLQQNQGKTLYCVRISLKNLARQNLAPCSWLRAPLLPLKSSQETQKISQKLPNEAPRAFQELRGSPQDPTRSHNNPRSLQSVTRKPPKSLPRPPDEPPRPWSASSSFSFWPPPVFLLPLLPSDSSFCCCLCLFFF